MLSVTSEIKAGLVDTTAKPKEPSVMFSMMTYNETLPMGKMEPVDDAQAKAERWNSRGKHITTEVTQGALAWLYDRFILPETWVAPVSMAKKRCCRTHAEYDQHGYSTVTLNAARSACCEQRWLLL